MSVALQKELKKIRVNCIGLGHWGPNLVRSFVNHPQVEVGIICDLDENRIATTRQKIKGVLGSTTDFREAIADPSADAVVISTPTSTHYELTRMALEAGRHVLVEKPIAIEMNEAVALAKLADKQERLLAVGHVFLFNTAVRAVNELIQTGEIGRIQYIQCTRTNLGPFRTDCSALWDLASHDLSIVNYWLRAMPDSVTAFGRSYLNEPLEDVVNANFNYPDGVMVSIHASWLNPCKVRQILVVGERKMVLFDDMNMEKPVAIFTKDTDWFKKPIYVDDLGEFRSSIPKAIAEYPEIPFLEPLASQVADFIDSIIKHKTPVNHVRGAVDVVACLTAAQKSMRDRSEIIRINEYIL